MPVSQQSRDDKAAEELVVSDDRQRCEALRHEYYNSHYASTESLIVKVCPLLGGFERPSWVAAELLSVRPSTIYQWTHQGFIPHVKLGRLVRFNETEVMKWVEDRSTDGRKTRRVGV